MHNSNTLEILVDNVADILRGKMDRDEFKEYIFSFVFYKSVSINHPEIGVRTLSELLEADEISEDIKIEIDKIDTYLNLDESIFYDLNLDGNKLGKTFNEIDDTLKAIIKCIDEAGIDYDECDLLSDLYEALLHKLSSQKASLLGEFYTPKSVSSLLAKIVSQNKTSLSSIYDPTCGSGSLLMGVISEIGNVEKIYGQELKMSSFSVAMMNAIMNFKDINKIDIKSGDTLLNPKHLDKRFEAIVANPPYSVKWNVSNDLLEDERFKDYNKLAPKSKADFAFIQHMLHHLDDNGTMAVVLPHGVLFRGAAEGHIREFIIKEQNYLDAVIGLPSDIFYGTGIPTCILVFKKCREHEDVLFVDASTCFEKGKNKNYLRTQDINRIVDAYKNRQEEDKFSHLANLKEIAENDYNLNIPRYVDTFEKEAEIDLSAITANLKQIELDMKEVDETIKAFCAELGLEAPV